MISLAFSNPAARTARPSPALIRRADGWHLVGQPALGALHTMADLRRVGVTGRITLLRDITR